MKRYSPAFFAAIIVSFAWPLEILEAQPRTLYGPADIRNARHNAERHDWARAIVEGWREKAAFAVRQERGFFEALIPDLTPGSFYGQNCPACVGDQSVMGETGVFRWEIESPDQVTCNRCSTVYPHRDYPETGVLELPRMGQVITYYETPEERANPQERERYALKWLTNRPTATSFSGMIRYGRVRWAWQQALLCAKLFAVTGEPAYAERSAWILDRFARVFPNYLYHSYDGTYADLPPAEVAAAIGAHPRGGRFAREVIRHPYGLNQGADHATLFNGFFGAGRISVHGKGSDAGPLLDLTVAYDLISGSRRADGRPMVDEASRQRIVRDLIIAGCDDLQHWDSPDNKGVAAYVLSAAVGNLLQQPERVRFALQGFERTLETYYHFDGFNGETPSYAEDYFEHIFELPEVLYGYSDPAGYEPPDGRRIEDLNLYEVGRARLALESLMRMFAPGERLPVIGDTHYDTGLNPQVKETLAVRLGGRYAGWEQGLAPNERTEFSLWHHRPRPGAARTVDLPLRTEWFPGWHVAVLRGGRPENDTALYLNGNEHRWTIRTGHRQPDVLSLSYYAFGEELASDRGYFSGSGQLTRDGRPGREWTHSTRSHNLVVVDETDQITQRRGSHLELFGTGPGVEVVQLAGFNVYAQCNEYRRTNALIQTPDGQTYLVDFFRVGGGKLHQYAFQSSGTLTRGRPAPEAAAPLSPFWSRWLEDARAVREPNRPPRFTWRNNGVNLDLLLLNSDLSAVMVADAPGWRKGSPASELEKPPIQQVLAERRAPGEAAELRSQYAAVAAPYRSAESPILQARLLAGDPDRGAMAVEVRLAGRTDYIISTRDQERRQFGPVTAAGEFAFVSIDSDGRLIHAYLLAGTALEYGDQRIMLPEPARTLRVQSIAGRTIRLIEPLPPGTAIPGTYLLAAGPPPATPPLTDRPQTGYQIESAGSDSITVRDYPVVPSEEVTILRSGFLTGRSE